MRYTVILQLVKYVLIIFYLKIEYNEFKGVWQMK